MPDCGKLICETAVTCAFCLAGQQHPPGRPSFACARSRCPGHMQGLVSQPLLNAAVEKGLDAVAPDPGRKGSDEASAQRVRGEGSAAPPAPSRGAYRNEFNTCWLSAVIQALLHEPSVRVFVRNHVQLGGCVQEECPLCLLHQSERDAAVPGSVASVNCWRSFVRGVPGFAWGTQQCALEFLDVLVARIPRLPRSEWLRRFGLSQWTSVVRSGGCGCDGPATVPVPREETWHVLALRAPQDHASIADLIHQHLAPEPLVDSSEPCRSCGSVATMVRRIEMDRVGQALLVSVQRTMPGPRGFLVKNCAAVTFGSRLSMVSVDFRLVALVEHEGESHDQGHYVAWTPSRGGWTRYDDDRVQTLTALPFKVFAGVVLLVYARDKLDVSTESMARVCASSAAHGSSWSRLPVDVFGLFARFFSWSDGARLGTVHSRGLRAWKDAEWDELKCEEKENFPARGTFVAEQPAPFLGSLLQALFQTTCVVGLCRDSGLHGAGCVRGQDCALCALQMSEAMSRRLGPPVGLSRWVSVLAGFPGPSRGGTGIAAGLGFILSRMPLDATRSFSGVLGFRGGAVAEGLCACRRKTARPASQHVLLPVGMATGPTTLADLWQALFQPCSDRPFESPCAKCGLFPYEVRRLALDTDWLGDLLIFFLDRTNACGVEDTRENKRAVRAPLHFSMQGAPYELRAVIVSSSSDEGGEEHFSTWAVIGGAMVLYDRGNVRFFSNCTASVWERAVAFSQKTLVFCGYQILLSLGSSKGSKQPLY